VAQGEARRRRVVAAVADGGLRAGARGCAPRASARWGILGHGVEDDRRSGRALVRGVTDESERRRWLPDRELRARTSTSPKSARFDWEDGSTRVVVGFDAKGDAKSQVALQHERIPAAEAAEEMKAFWRGRLSAAEGADGAVAEPQVSCYHLGRGASTRSVLSRCCHATPIQHTRPWRELGSSESNRDLRLQRPPSYRLDHSPVAPRTSVTADRRDECSDADLGTTR
jgi:hypothetical protein